MLIIDIITDTQIWASLITLTLLEVVLGVDNLVFLAIITGRVDQRHQKLARQLGLILACVMRILLLASATWIMKLTYPVLSYAQFEFSWRDLFLLFGGLFLLIKGTQEIHQQFEDALPDNLQMNKGKKLNFFVAILQIMMLDIVFSLDSVITAVGMSQQFWIMASAIIIAIIAMLFVSETLSRFIERHPSIKMLALSFLILVGVVLIADGFGFHIPRGYIYFAIGFSIAVETLNITLSKRRRSIR